MSPGSYETVETDLLVLGAGGAGLRGAIAAAEAGARVLVICKSLLGKAHTVMAEGAWPPRCTTLPTRTPGRCTSPTR